MIVVNQVFDEAASSESEKLFDLAMLFEMDDNQYVAQMLTIFLRDTPKELQQIKEAAAAKKLKVVRSAAHKLKSSAGIIGANALLVLLEEIECLSMAESISEELMVEIENAKAAFNKLQSQLHLVLTALQ